MKRKIMLLSLIFLFSVASSALPKQIRKPVWDGKFYYKNKSLLSLQIDSFLKNVKISNIPPGELQVIVVPHAGYVYSGQIAAYSYKLVQGRDYEKVIIIGPSHRYGFEGCSIYPQGAYQTPLGVTDIDSVLASKLSKATGFTYIPQAHQSEHSVEVQIPFIQKTLPQAKIVPIVMGLPKKKTIHALAKALAEVVPKKKALIVASTDLSHFEPKTKANKIDANTISLLQSLKTGTLIRKAERYENIMCGGGPVVSALLYTQERGKPKVHVLKYGDSSLTGGPASEVVGYLAAAIFSESPPPTFSLTLEEKKELIKISQLAITKFINVKNILDYKTQNSNFLVKKGAFVTLKKRGYLRGCIGIIEPLFPLYQTVIRASIYAACEDPRFPPVAPKELNDLEIEISVLSPLEKISNPKQVIVGKHGLVISKNGKKGLLLPQVPVENNWSRKEFLEQACIKSGLPREAWKKGAEIYIFEAIVFH
ncbi:MAG: AmmeMemoRadiSam system protein B [Candidatus Aminicenantaceae bacterium]